MRGEMFKAIESVLSSKHVVKVDASAHHSIVVADTRSAWRIRKKNESSQAQIPGVDTSSHSRRRASVFESAQMEKRTPSSYWRQPEEHGRDGGVPTEPDDRSFHTDPRRERAPTIVPDPGSPEELPLPPNRLRAQQRTTERT